MLIHRILALSPFSEKTGWMGKGFPSLISNLTIYLFDQVFELGFHHVAPALRRYNDQWSEQQSSMIPLTAMRSCVKGQGPMFLVLGGRRDSGWDVLVGNAFMTSYSSCSHNNNTIEQQPGWRVLLYAYAGAVLRARPVGADAWPWHPSSAGLSIAERRRCCHGMWVER